MQDLQIFQLSLFFLLHCCALHRTVCFAACRCVFAALCFDVLSTLCLRCTQLFIKTNYGCLFSYYANQITEAFRNVPKQSSFENSSFCIFLVTLPIIKKKIIPSLSDELCNNSSTRYDCKHIYLRGIHLSSEFFLHSSLRCDCLILHSR